MSKESLGIRVKELIINEFEVNESNYDSAILNRIVTSSIDLLELFLLLEKEFDVEFKYEDMVSDIVLNVDNLVELLNKYIEENE